MDHLTRVQRDILIIIAGIGPTEGVTIGDELDEYYHSSVSYQQVYHALEGLVESEYIKKRSQGKSNQYQITPDGENVLSIHRDWQDRVRNRETME